MSDGPASPRVLAGAEGRVGRWQVPAICLALIAITFAVFGQTASFQFVNYDDKTYVYDNPVVQKGLTLRGLAWALTYGKIGHWHPLTWLTHMADCQFYGLWAGGHHLTNVFLQAMAAVLLFLALREMTGNVWRCALVAAVFAIHPLRVESVAWVAERKDVLSGVFSMATLWAYARYARQPTCQRGAIIPILYGLGLLCKNSLVTLPFVLLLLDWWPLWRLSPHEITNPDGNTTSLARRLGGLVKEKIPLFILAVGSCVATALVPEKVMASERIPFLERCGNAAVSYAVYLRQMFFPRDLAIPYLNPPGGLAAEDVALAIVLLAAISFAVLVWRKKFPCVVVGWLWYLGMLVPMIGFIQISYYAHADRYTYLPGIGLTFAVVWMVGDACAAWRVPRAVPGSLSVVIIATLMVCAWRQTGYWKDSETLWTHSIAATSGNFVAHYDLGLALDHQGRMDEAITHYREALEINPHYAAAHSNLGMDLAHGGNVDEAILHFQDALKIEPDLAEACYNLGNAYLQKKNAGDAIAQFQRALQIEPDSTEAHNNLGNVLRQTGKVDEAIAHFQRALELSPDDVDAHDNLGLAFRQTGKIDQAIAQFEAVVQLKPDSAEAHNSLGSALRQAGRVDEAIAHYQAALRLKSDYAEAHYNLGNAFMEQKNMGEAVFQFQQSLAVKPNQPNAENNLAWILATSPEASLRDGPKAVELAQQANSKLGGENPPILHTLAAAYAEAGRFPEAIDTAQRALGLAEKQGNDGLAHHLRLELQLYQARSAYHASE